MRVFKSTTYGIFARGSGHTIRNNLVMGVNCSTCEAVGISVAGGGGAMVAHNRVVNDGGSAFRRGIDYRGNGVIEGNHVDLGPLNPASIGILIMPTSSRVFVVDNRIGRAGTGIAFEADATGKYRDNLTGGCTTPFSGGTDAGNNN